MTERTRDALDEGRESFARQAWGDAYAQLAAAAGQALLEPSDLELLAIAAALTGRDEESAVQWERAHLELARRGEVARAARCAFWLAFGLLNRDEVARGGGWLARARRLLDDEGPADCVERGYLILPDGLQRIVMGDYAEGLVLVAEAVALGDRFGDTDLVILARHVQGQGLIMQGNVADGVALLDEIMVAVLAGEVSPIVTGTVYCGVIGACQKIFDLRRAKEWTAALTRWVESQPGLVAYTGQCLVHRAEIMQLHGAWPDAIDEARRSCERFLRTDHYAAAGAAHYQLAEVHRLRGEFVQAEEAYREASRLGHEPHPGLALLRLAQGQAGTAAAAIRRVAGEEADHAARTRLLPGYVEIMLAVGDVDAARAGAEELAADFDVPLLRAMAAQAAGSVQLAAGDPRAALDELRTAWKTWRDLDVPYEAARVRVFIGLACRELGDEDGAQMEFDAARWVFEQLGAMPDAAKVTALTGREPEQGAGGLTAREIQVLRLVAAGKTNRAIASDLFLSEKTVARHVSNILTKLDLSSRAAATAYAYEHDLFER